MEARYWRMDARQRLRERRLVSAKLSGKVLANGGPAGSGIPYSDIIQTGLSAAQFFPPTAIPAYVAGIPFTAYDMYQDYKKGDYTQMGLDALGLIPGFGKNLSKGINLIKKGSAAAKAVNRLNTADKAVNLANMGISTAKAVKDTRAKGGELKPLNSDTVEVKGPSHENGGVYLPKYGAEVEGNETIKDEFVYSDRLGFAQQHKPIASAIGRLEKSKQVKGVGGAINRLRGQEEKLKLAQEYFKHINGI